MNEIKSNDIMTEIGEAELISTNDDIDVDLNDYFGLNPETDGGNVMESYSVTEQVSDDGYLHIKVPAYFYSKQVDVLVLPTSNLSPETNTTNENETSVQYEWDIDYGSDVVSSEETFDTLEMLEDEFGSEDPSKWK